MTGQINGVLTKGSRTLARRSGPGPSESFTRPDLVIPCQVARQQSLTPFHQAPAILPRVIGIPIAVLFICPVLPEKTQGGTDCVGDAQPGAAVPHTGSRNYRS